MLGNLRSFVFAGAILKDFGATDQEAAWPPSAPPDQEAARPPSAPPDQEAARLPSAPLGQDV